MSMLRVATAVACLLFVSPAFAQAPDVRLRSVKEGDAQLTGFVLPPPAAAATGYVVELYQVDGATRRFLDRVPVPSFGMDGAFTVMLTAPVRAGTRIELSLMGKVLTGGTIDVVSAGPSGGLRPVRAGSRNVSGFVANAGDARLFVEVRDPAAPVPVPLQRRRIESVDANGAFTVTLDASVPSGSVIALTANGATLFTAPAGAALIPTLTLGPLRPGAQQVTGALLGAPDDPTSITFTLTEGDNLLERKRLERIDAATGTFTVALAAPLRSGQILTAEGAGMTALTATVPAFKDKVTLYPGLVDGAQRVTGHIDARTTTQSVEIRVLRSRLESGDLSHAAQIASTSEISDKGEFSVTLDRKLVAGQVVRAQAFTAAREGSSEVTEANPVVDPGSWGRARAYFAGGVVFSKDRGDFSKQDLTLALVIDKGWLQSRDFRLPLEVGDLSDDERKPLLDAEKALRDCELEHGKNATNNCKTERKQYDSLKTAYGPKGRVRWRGLNTFVDTRLTALPVVTPETSTTTTTETTTTNPDGTQNTSTEKTTTMDRFIDSRKGAVIQAGIYVPFFGPQTAWVYDGAVNTLFFAPVVRAGIQTINSDDGGATLNAKGETDDVFHFWGAGIGIGHQKLSGTTNQTPEIISYLHIVLGSSEAFQYRNAEGKIVDNLRTMVEGRLKIPSTPLQIGFDANLGHGRDDLRFVFGTRFDIGELFGRLQSFSK